MDVDVYDEEEEQLANILLDFTGGEDSEMDLEAAKKRIKVMPRKQLSKLLRGYVDVYQTDRAFDRLRQEQGFSKEESIYSDILKIQDRVLEDTAASDLREASVSSSEGLERVRRMFESQYREGEFPLIDARPEDVTNFIRDVVSRYGPLDPNISLNENILQQYLAESSIQTVGALMKPFTGAKSNFEVGLATTAAPLSVDQNPAFVQAIIFERLANENIRLERLQRLYDARDAVAAASTDPTLEARKNMRRLELEYRKALEDTKKGPEVKPTFALGINEKGNEALGLQSQWSFDTQVEQGYITPDTWITLIKPDGKYEFTKAYRLFPQE